MAEQSQRQNRREELAGKGNWLYERAQQSIARAGKGEEGKQQPTPAQASPAIPVSDRGPVTTSAAPAMAQQAEAMQENDRVEPVSMEQPSAIASAVTQGMGLDSASERQPGLHGVDIDAAFADRLRAREYFKKPRGDLYTVDALKDMVDYSAEGQPADWLTGNNAKNIKYVDARGVTTPSWKPPKRFQRKYGSDNWDDITPVVEAELSARQLSKKPTKRVSADLAKARKGQKSLEKQRKGAKFEQKMTDLSGTGSHHQDMRVIKAVYSSMLDGTEIPQSARDYMERRNIVVSPDGDAFVNGREYYIEDKGADWLSESRRVQHRFKIWYREDWDTVSRLYTDLNNSAEAIFARIAGAENVAELDSVSMLSLTNDIKEFFSEAAQGIRNGIYRQQVLNSICQSVDDIRTQAEQLIDEYVSEYRNSQSAFDSEMSAAVADEEEAASREAEDMSAYDSMYGQLHEDQQQGSQVEDNVSTGDEEESALPEPDMEYDTSERVMPGEEAETFVEETTRTEGVFSAVPISNEEYEKHVNSGDEQSFHKKKHEEALNANAEQTWRYNDARSVREEVRARVKQVDEYGRVSYGGIPKSIFDAIEANVSLYSALGVRIDGKPGNISIEGVVWKFVQDPHTKQWYSVPTFGDADEYVNAVCDYYDNHDLNEMLPVIIGAGSIGVDTKMQICNTDPRKFELRNEQLAQLARSIIGSNNIRGSRYGFNIPYVPIADTIGTGRSGKDNKYVDIAGPSYPLWHVTKAMFRAMSRSENSPLHDVSYEEFNRALEQNFEENCRADLEEECAETGNDAKIRALRLLNSSLLYVDDHSEETVYRHLLYGMSSDQVSFNHRSTFKDDPILQMADEARNKNQKMFLDFVSKRYQGTNNKQYQRILHNLARTVCITGTLNPIILVSGVIEGLEAQAEMKVAATLQKHKLEKIYGKSPEIDKLFDMDTELEEMLGENWFEAYQVLSALCVFDGWNAVARMMTAKKKDGTDYDFTKDDLQEFMNNEVYGAEEGKWSKRLDTATEKLMGIMLADVPGKFQEMEAKNFMRNILYQNALVYQTNRERVLSDPRLSKMKGFALEALTKRSCLQNYGEVHDAQEIKSMLRIGGDKAASNVMKALIVTPSGTDAFLLSGSMSYARKSPLQQGLKRILNKSGFTDIGFRFIFDRYPEYGLNKILILTPFSLTGGYFVSTGILSTTDFAFDPVEGTKIPGWLDRGQNYQAGIGAARSAAISQGKPIWQTDEWKIGLRRCMLYDSMKFGGKSIVALTWLFVLLALGLQPPEEKEDYWLPWEWRVGRGEEAVPIREQWWADDLMGFGYPFGMALAARFSGASAIDSYHIWQNAMFQQVDGDVFVEGIQFITHLPETFDRLMDGEIDAEQTRNHYLQKYLSRIFKYATPAVVNQMFPFLRSCLYHSYGTLDHTSSMTWDWNGNEVKPDSMTEERLFYSQDNLLYMLANYLWDDAVGSNYDNQYMWSRQPLSTIYDPVALELSKQYKWDNTRIYSSEEELREAYFDHGETFYEDMQAYDSPAEAAADGVYVDNYTLIAAGKYCKLRAQQYRDWYFDQPEGQRPDWDWYNSTYVQPYVDWEFLWVENNNGALTDVPMYYKVLGDSAVRYRDAEGNPIDAFTYTFTPSSTKEYYSYGNSRSFLQNISPVYSPMHDEPWIGYNEETIPTQLRLTPEQLFEITDDLIFEASAAYRGKNAKETYFAGVGTNEGEFDEELQLGPNDTPTVGRRGLVPVVSDVQMYVLEDEIDGDFVGTLSNGIGNGNGTAGQSSGGKSSGNGNEHRQYPGTLTMDDVNVPSGKPPTTENQLIEDKAAYDKAADEFLANLPDEYKNIGMAIVASLEGWPWAPGAALGSGDGSDDDGFDADPTDNPEFLDAVMSMITDGGGYPNYYPGYRVYRSSSRGSSSGYAPRIYSNSRNVNASRAEGMSTRSPYKATNTYLHPMFATKGSSEAYRRQDI